MSGEGDARLGILRHRLEHLMPLSGIVVWHCYLALLSGIVKWPRIGEGLARDWPKQAGPKQDWPKTDRQNAVKIRLRT